MGVLLAQLDLRRNLALADQLLHLEHHIPWPIFSLFLSIDYAWDFIGAADHHVCYPMSLLSSLSRCQANLSTSSTTPSTLFDLLVPALYKSPAQDARRAQSHGRRSKIGNVRQCPPAHAEQYFFAALRRASICSPSSDHRSRKSRTPTRKSLSTAISRRKNIIRWHGDQYQPDHEADPTLVEEPPDPGGGRCGSPENKSQRHTFKRGFFDSQAQRLSELSHLPQDFFDDVSRLQGKAQNPISDDDGWDSNETWPMQLEPPAKGGSMGKPALSKQLKLLSTVRELEEKLAQAKQGLETSLRPRPRPTTVIANSAASEGDDDSLTLTREDYKGLVDLYYYTHKNRFTPEAPDYSPTPTFLEDYNFMLSEDFAGPEAYANYYHDEEGYESPLKEIEQILKSRRLREVSVMQKFVELLIDNNSSNRALFEVYRKLPSPGVAFLPKGIIRVFLQRMSTPAVKTGGLMLRYLSLIDDMQKAKLSITRSEWSSAIYLAGRSFGKVTQSDMAHAFKLWREMEQDAGVKGSYVTFNILFDIAVRAGKYPIADGILREMHARGLRLNRLGRVSLIYYHGLRGDGDAVRKTYRDFVDAGEIVDTLVLNCVIASLMNAGEPAAAEQIYERMKDLQQRMIEKRRADGSDLIYKRYPRGGSVHMDEQLAGNSLGRVLLKASKLRSVLPAHHQELQDSMPLRPDYHTFKAMISYHANVSGDFNRLTVLMNEMIETFGIPMQAIHFQLLFKGFALHGMSRDPDSSWNAKRLELAWDACRSLIKGIQQSTREPSHDKSLPSLPSAKAAEMLEDDSLAMQHPPTRRKASSWLKFALDIAVFPEERRQSIERVHAELFDQPKVQKTRQNNSFFVGSSELLSSQEGHYSLGNSALDHEEGEYTLPSPGEAIHANNPLSDLIHRDWRGDSNRPRNDHNERGNHPNEVRLTRSCVCWLLRAYSRCTSRERLERVWNSVRLLWHPENEEERQSVLRVLRRCLKDADVYDKHML